MKNIVITGVSTGIGYASTKILIKNGYRVFGSVRKTEDSDKLTEDFGDNFIPLLFDVTEKKSVYEAADFVRDYLGQDKNIDGLINNAGIGLGGPLLELPVDIIRKQFEVNLFGVVTVTQAFSELLGCNLESSPKGKIIMISSVSGKRAFPFVGPYTASKHALEGLSDSLRRELLIYGVDVVLVEPGPIKTAIWDKVADIESSPFRGSVYESALRKFHSFFMKKGKNGLDADIVGRLILKIIQNNKPKTRYVITQEKLISYILPGILPDRILDKQIGKGLGLLK